jgi:hypothetical protein
MMREEAIRALFLEGKSHYSLAEAATLLRWSKGKLAEEIAASELRPIDADAIVPWRVVAVFAVTEWSPEMIEDALGAEIIVLPDLLRLGELCIRLPRYQIVALEAAARRSTATISEYLSQYLLDQTCTEAPALVRTVEGFREAYIWPRSDTSESATPANFGMKLPRPAVGPAAELPPISPG